MSHRLKHAVLYLVFVGVPLLGLVGVLRAGIGIVPPVSVGGRWKLESGNHLASAIACGSVVDEDPSVLRIGQSGPHLRMELRDTTTVPLQGDIAGTRVTGHATIPPPGPPTLQLQAEVDRHANPQTLVGTFEVDRCPSPGSSGQTAQAGQTGQSSQGPPATTRVTFRAVRDTGGSP